MPSIFRVSGYNPDFGLYSESVCRVSIVPHSLHIKDIISKRSGRMVTSTKGYILSSLPNSSYFLVAVKCRFPVCPIPSMGRLGRDRMVVGSTSTYVIGADHH